MIRLATILIFLLAVINLKVAHSQEIGFVEDFALAENRDEVLRRLVPGTREYYYFHALHYQTSGQLDKVDQILENWIKRYGETEQVKIIQNRQALLRFESDPEKTYRFLKDRLQLNFSHQREIPATERNLPTQLDQEQVASDRYRREALRRHGDLAGVEDTGLESLDAASLDRNRRRQLLSRLSWPDYPDLVTLVVQDLREKDSGGFGSLNIHSRLTMQQLDDCLRSIPKLIDNQNFVNIYLGKLLPGDDVDWRADREQYRAYLQKLYEFTRRLNPSFNSLKACVLYRLLELDLASGQYDRNLFLEYLKLPRQIEYVHPRMITELKSRSYIVDLNADYRAQIKLVPIYSDQALVREYLHHFLLPTETYDAFRPYLRESWLKKQFATVKILNGVGDAEQWASMLTPEEYRHLLSRVDLDFARTNVEFYADDDQVQIDLYTKNVPTLIVKIFEINTFNYYRTRQREIDTDINLDGLVPNSEKTYRYDDEPVLRQRRSFTFEDLGNPGVYVVDFIGGGKSSRALIRRGRLSMVGQTTVAGQRFHIYDQNQEPVADASLWISGRSYEPDESGVITVPFSNQPGTQQAIISRGEFSSLQQFGQLGEQYSLEAAMVVDRESLLSSQPAKLYIRPGLKITGVPTSVGLLTDVQLVITSTSQSGVSSTKRVDDLVLSDDRETECEFVVPPRLKTLTFELSAKVENISGNTEQKLATARSYEINQIDGTDEIQDVHLMPIDSGYLLEVLGKTGEKRPQQAVRVEFKHRDFKDPLSVVLQSDADGRIDLGRLENIVSIQATIAGGSTRSWRLGEDTVTRPTRINVPYGATVQIAAPAALDKVTRSDVSLYETRQGSVVADHFDRIVLKAGLLQIGDLNPGNYALRLKRIPAVIQITVVDGKTDRGVVVGKHRHAEIRDVRPLVIESISPSGDQMQIQLGHANKYTRVHVLATRYQPRFESFNEFSRVGGIPPWMQLQSLRRSAYMAGRKLGDEYQYILNRRYASKYPGNMLSRPAVLIRPWSTRESGNQVESLASGEEFSDAGTDADKKASRGQESERLATSNVDFANLDFLGQASVVLSNLKPDADGRVTIDKQDLEGLTMVRVIAIDPDSTVEQSVRFEPSRLKVRDLRLARPLDPAGHYCQRKQIELLRAGDELLIGDLTSGRFQYFDEIGDVFRLYLMLNRNTRLAEFEFLLDWSSRSEDEKRTLYSEHACHELNYYLYRKDRPFFDSVIRRHIGFKAEQGMVDDFLTDGNLARFLNPWQYSRLNVFEKILLSERLGEQSAEIIRNIDDQYLLEPTRREWFDSLYDSSLGTDGLVSSELQDRENIQPPGTLPQLESDLSRAPAPTSFDSLGGAGGGARGGRQLKDELVDVAQLRASERSLKGGGLFAPAEKAEAAAGRRPPRVGIAGSSGENSLARRPDGSAEPDPENRAAASVEMFNYSQADRDNLELGLGDKFFGFEDADNVRRLRGRTKSLYRRLSPTREWIEQQYFHVPMNQQTPDLVTTNRFWRDYANQQGDGFLSPYFAEAHRSLTEMMFALAVLDLPEKAPQHELDYADNSLDFTAGGPLIAFHQQFQPAAYEPGRTTILVTENFFQKNDRVRHQDGVQYDKFITGNFYAHTLYGSQVVMTNPTSTPQAMDLLVQIPQGAIAASGSQQTRSLQIQLDAFSTRTFEYHFYFPTAGKFSHYPAHVSREDVVLAVADPLEFNVIDAPVEVDRTSWQFVSQNASQDEVIEFLQAENVLRLELGRIAFRMQDKPFFERTIDTLRNRRTYDHTLWSYAIYHRDLEGSREFLQHENRIAEQVGKYFRSAILDVMPYERNWYQHREYSPLVNGRVHQLGARRKILNPDLYRQYHLLLDVLSHRGNLDSSDHLVVTYYLLLQDRIDEAIKHFRQVSQDDLVEQIQYQYCSAYLDFYLSDHESAAAKAARWADYPVDLWRDRFRNILAQVEEIRGGEVAVTDDRDNVQQQTRLASQAASFDFEIESEKVKVAAQNISRIVVNYYEMDVELMFSRSPFTEKNFDGFSVIRPNSTQTIELEKGAGSTAMAEFGIPAEFANRNVLVEINAGDQVKAKPSFASSMLVQTIEKYGQLKVVQDENQQPIPQAYVKVYSRADNGAVKFHKDGYTDLRGRFDYVSQSNNPVDGIRQYSILVLSPEHGVVSRQVAPPAE